MITSGGKRKPAKPDLDAGTLTGRRRISPACSLAVIRRCNSARGIDDTLNSGIRSPFQQQESDFFCNAERAATRMGYAQGWGVHRRRVVYGGPVVVVGIAPYQGGRESRLQGGLFTR